MKRWRLISIVSMAGVLAVAWGGRSVRRPGTESAVRTIPVASQAPVSCKPRPPVQVTLDPESTGGAWRVHLNAFEDAADITLVAGTSHGAVETGSRVLWHGSLRQGAAQDFEARLPLAGDDTSVWAEARIGSGPGATQRGLAVVSVSNGKAVAPAVASAPGERTVTDPNTGASVVEYQGQVAGRP